MQKNLKPEGYISFNGGSIVGQTDKTIKVQIWLTDQRDYAFSVTKIISKKDIQAGYKISGNSKIN